MIELIRYNGIRFTKQGLKNASVGIESRHIQNSVLHSEEFRNLLFQLFMDILGAADKTYTAETISPFIQYLMSSPDHLGMGRKAQVIIRAEIQDFAPVHNDFCPLFTGKHPFGFK